MSMRHFMAALLVASAFLLAPRIGLAQKYSKPAYTPPPPTPPRVYTPPARSTTPSNSNVRSPGTAPQSSNNNSVRPTPRVTVTPRTPQPGRTPVNLTRTPSNNNNPAQQVANSNLKHQQQRQLQQKQLFAQKQQQQKQFQQKQLFAQKQQQQKLSDQKVAESKARLAKLSAKLGQKGTLTPTFKDAANGKAATPASAGTGDSKPPTTLTDKFNNAARPAAIQTKTVETPPATTLKPHGPTLDPPKN